MRKGLTSDGCLAADRGQLRRALQQLKEVVIDVDPRQLAGVGLHTQLLQRETMHGDKTAS